MSLIAPERTRYDYSALAVTPVTWSRQGVRMQPSLSDYLSRQWVHIRPMVLEQVQLIAIVMLLAAVVGIGIGLLVWSRPVVSSLTIGAAAGFLTIPSLAVMTLFLPIFGLGWTGTVVALVLYAQ